jgi:hypothetical protein
MVHTGLTYLAIWVGRWTEQDTNEATQQIGLNLGIYFMLARFGHAGPCRGVLVSIPIQDAPSTKRDAPVTN